MLQLELWIFPKVCVSLFVYLHRWALKSFVLLCVSHDLAAVTGSWTNPTPQIVSQNPFTLYKLITIGTFL